jgi:Fe-S cluster assembly iron-binding protein IscA
MVTVTDTARTEIRNLTAQPEVPDGGGLRIATDQSTGSLTLSLAAAPVEGDAVLDDDGARLFLDSEATVVLDGKALDAAKDEQGRVQFAVAEQQA